MNLPEELVAARAIAFDVDGTLAGTDNLVSPRSLRALAALHAAGVEPIIVTGRVLHAATRILDDAGIPGFAVAANGSVTADTRDSAPLHTSLMDPGEVAAVVRFADGRAIEPALFTTEAMVVESGSVIHGLLRAADPISTTLALPRDRLPLTQTTKVAVFGEAATLDALDGEIRAAFPRMLRSMDTAFEMTASGTGKWTALTAVLDLLELDPAEVAGVGDGENDVEWLSRVGFPIAMGNAREPVRALALLQIGVNGDDAVAELIESVVAARAAR